MKRTLLFALFALSSIALAQKGGLFSNGKPAIVREAEIDKRFNKTKLAQGLRSGSEDPNCVQVLGALFTALGEAAPMLHKKDDSFTLDPVLLAAVTAQLNNPRFPGSAYLTAMVRRVLIDKRLPDEWYDTAAKLNEEVQIIDLGKLKMLNEGLKPIDSFYFTLPALKERYLLEVVRANSAVTTDVAGAFRDNYLDREVAWPGAILIDTGYATNPGGKKTRGSDGEDKMIAELEWQPPVVQQGLAFFEPKKEPPIRIVAHLAPKQYIDLERVPRGKRMLVRGRFWEMNRTVTEVELKNALLFEDRDWTGALLAEPAAVTTCAMAINDLTGVVPSQPGGFKH
ncbi:MAG: hypothetical protein K1X64_13425 [Myxococcaceae bacterium]|nr:hypothetical protein [Myxococcaceae bacterium]